MFGAVLLYREANTHAPVLFVPGGVTRLLLSIDPKRKPGHIQSGVALLFGFQRAITPPRLTR